MSTDSRTKQETNKLTQGTNGRACAERDQDQIGCIYWFSIKFKSLNCLTRTTLEEMNYFFNITQVLSFMQQQLSSTNSRQHKITNI